MFVKDFKHLSPPALSNSIATRGHTCFPNFHSIHCTMHLFNMNSPHCTLYLTSIMLSLHSFSTFINFSICSFQIFFQPSTLSFTAPLSSLRQLTPATFFFSPTFCLIILIFFLMSANHFRYYLLVLVIQNSRCLYNYFLVGFIYLVFPFDFIFNKIIHPRRQWNYCL